MHPENLADLGAEVTKVEHPERGDDTRGWGLPYMPAADGSDARLSAYFISCNRGKRSVAIDYGTPEGAAQVGELAREADVLVENYKVGTLRRYGLDYDSLKAINPRLIYLSITGFGQDGPMADKPGYDYVFQGMGGLMSYTGQPDGSPGAGPPRTGVAVVDLSTGMYATSAVLAALYQRQATGVGQHLDIALLDRSRRAQCQPGRQLPGVRREPAAQRQCTPELCAVRSVPLRG
ncbi:CaiB/BaiF CoA transferase family protein [Cupriavidus basilensis]